MTLTAVKPGGWDVEEVLTSDQMNALQVELLKAIDGVNGGTYSPVSDLVIGGPGELIVSTTLSILTDLIIEAAAFLQVMGTLQLSGVQTVTGDINVPSGGEINIQNLGRIDVESGGDVNLAGGADMTLAGTDGGADLDIASGARLGLSGTATVFGSVNLSTGGQINVPTGCHIDIEGSNGRINLASGAKILGSSGAEMQVFDADDLTINSSSVDFRLSLVPVFVEESTPGTPDWVPEIGGTWLMSTAAGGHILFPLPLRVGDVIISLTMTINGSAGPGANHGTNPADMPALELIRVNASGVTNSVQTAVDPVTGASYGSAHPVTLSGGLFPYTVPAGEVLYVRVLAEGPTGGIANATRLCSIAGSLLAKSFRGLNEVY
jgi:hypothetical protein